MKILLIVAAAVLGLSLLLVVGFKVTPAPFSPYPGPPGKVSTRPLPEGLPAPVERFYKTLYGEELPVYTSAVISARTPMRINGITLPARIRFVHDAGEGYRHYIETTWFGITIMKIDERYIDGTAVMELPFGTFKGPEIDQGANLALWAEAVWFPSVWVTDPRIRWDAVDEETAILYVPFGEGEQSFVVRFDPDTGLLGHLESMRYKGVDAKKKTLWLNVAYEWEELNNRLTLTRAGVVWLDDGTPWAVFTLDDIVYNSDIEGYLRTKGP